LRARQDDVDKGKPGTLGEGDEFVHYCQMRRACGHRQEVG
jgi:hypothetical protein